MDKDPQNEDIDAIRANKSLRQNLASADPLWFSLLYLQHHFNYPFAPFQKEMFHLIRSDYDLMAVMAFRESGKSTILSTAQALWSILGKPEKRFVLLIGKTQEQAKNHFTNIKQELQTNKFLQEDFGPFTEKSDDWNKLSLELEYQGSKIIAIGRDQSVRGLKYGSYRPDLIICDDLEDTQPQTPAEKQELHRWFQQEVQPLGSQGTRIVVLGNYLSADSLILELRKDILQRRVPGIFRAYPLLDDQGRCLWKDRFTTKKKIQKLRSQFSSVTWAREYLLMPSADNDYYVAEEKDPDPFRKRFLKISSEYRKHFRALFNKYGSLQQTDPQVPLIRQMQRYQISAPIPPKMLEPKPEHPLYETHQAFKAELNALVKQYDDAIKDGYRRGP